MDTRQIRAFLAIADTGSVTRAAELLHVVQPAISRQLKLLEDDLGALLFERSRGGMVLTEAGRTLVEYSRRALRELDNARSEIQPSGPSIAGIVNVGLLPSSCELLAAPLVLALKDRYPGVQVSLSVGYTDHLARWLETGELDMALLYDAPQRPSVSLEPLLKEVLCLTAPAAHGLSLKKPVKVRALGQAPLVLPSRPHNLRGLVEHACAVAEAPFRIAAETNALSVQRDLVVQGVGFSVLPAVAIRSELERGLLSAAPIAAPEFARSIYLALPTTRRRSARPWRPRAPPSRPGRQPPRRSAATCCSAPRTSSSRAASRSANWCRAKPARPAPKASAKSRAPARSSASSPARPCATAARTSRRCGRTSACRPAANRSAWWA